MKKPSDFKQEPFNSLTQSFETELVASNIMKILARTGNTWRRLSIEEYEKERFKDGSFSKREIHFFDKVIDYTTCERKALEYSVNWGR